MNINDLFENRERKNYTQVRNYDVRVTLNKAGAAGFAIRFGFINNAFKALKGSPYIQISDVEKRQDRIYFRTFKERKFLDVYKLSASNKAKSSGLYVTIKPKDKAEQIFRTRWVGKTFMIQKDTDSGLHYIDLSQTA